MAGRRLSGLTQEQVVQLAQDVSAGRRPRVQVTGSQFPADTTGTVSRVGDPASEGAEYVTVRVKINGVVDELRFDPKELSRVSRGRANKPSATPEKIARARAVPKSPATTVPPSGRGSAHTASVSIAISSIGTAWAVTAHRGARALLKNEPVSPGVVASVAVLLGQSVIEDAVGAVNDTARVAAESRAQALRAELAQVEAVLDSHRRP